MSKWRGYLGALVLVALANVTAVIAGPPLAGTNLAMLFLMSVLLSGISFGLAPALLSAILAAVTYNFFFLEPRFTFWIEHTADLLTFSMFFLVALATGWLTGRVRDHARTTADRAAMIDALLDASRVLSATATPEEAAAALARQASSASGGAAIVLLPSAGDGLRIAAGPIALSELGSASASAAQRSWHSGKPCISGDATQGWSFQVLHGAHNRVGVIGLRSTSQEPGSKAQGLLAAMLQQGAVAIERAQLASAAAEAEGLRRADQLRSALLNSVSHDFRTPLATILGSVTTLLEYGQRLEPAVSRDLLESVREEAERLNRFIGDLLDMGRLEAGALQPRRTCTDVGEVIVSALNRLGDRLRDRRVVRNYSADLPSVMADPFLLEQALFNILDNAVAYGPDGSRIEVGAAEHADHILLSVRDEGPGVPREALRGIFDKFRRLHAPSDRTGGLGLGLAISKGFIEALGGNIEVKSPVADGKGTCFVITLPKADLPGDHS
jgi:two-component system, OmpR family, sensor histidine kinase KdpD